VYITTTSDPEENGMLSADMLEFDNTNGLDDDPMKPLFAVMSTAVIIFGSASVSFVANVLKHDRVPV
jgi:hypothetical protein